jgi:hypothetical protein
MNYSIILDINFTFVFLPCQCGRLLIVMSYKLLEEYFFDKNEFVFLN